MKTYKSIILHGILAFILIWVVSSCSISKKTTSTTLIEKSDSLYTEIDTTYQPGVVNVNIEGDTVEQASEMELPEVLITEEEYQQFLELLEMQGNDITNPEIIYQTIEKTRGLWSSDTSYLETDFAYSEAGVNKGKPFHTLIQKDTTFQQPNDSLIQIIHQKDKEIHYYKELSEFSEHKTKLPWWFYPLLFIGSVILVLVGVFIGKFL